MKKRDSIATRGHRQLENNWENESFVGERRHYKSHFGSMFIDSGNVFVSYRALITEWWLLLGKIYLLVTVVISLNCACKKASKVIICISLMIFQMFS